jgi:response regulator RpfG family c-di-GMP phosphodiesterase
MEKEKIHILYVDDEAHNLTAFKATFRKQYTIFTAESALEGKKILESSKVHIIITDQRMPGITGVEFLESILLQYPDPIRILLTGFADMEAVINAINKGQVYRYINKPWEEEELRLVIENAYEVYFLREQNRDLTAKLLKANEQLEFMLRQKLLS